MATPATRRIVDYTCGGLGLYYTGFKYRICPSCSGYGYAFISLNNFNIAFNGRLVSKDITEVFYPRLDGSEGRMTYEEFLEEYPDYFVIDRRAAIAATKRGQGNVR